MDENDAVAGSSNTGIASPSASSSPAPITRSLSLHTEVAETPSLGTSGARRPSSRKLPLSGSASLPCPTSSPTKPKPKSLAMLKREVDFVPLSPKKPHAVFKRDVGPIDPIKFPHPTHPTADYEKIDLDDDWLSDSTSNSTVTGQGAPSSPSKSITRSTEEKKQILGNLMGNVDALVDGVKKAGVWGLGA